jgi:hypothetical protein
MFSKSQRFFYVFFWHGSIQGSMSSLASALRAFAKAKAFGLQWEPEKEFYI